MSDPLLEDSASNDNVVGTRILRFRLGLPRGLYIYIYIVPSSTELEVVDN